MRRVTALALAIVLTVSALAVGYAYWTENLAVAGSVTTGNLNVDWDVPTVSAWARDDYRYPYSPFSTVITKSTSVSGKTVTATFGNVFPGAVLHWQGWGYNSGSIPAKFNGININVTSDPSSLAQYLFVVPTNTYMSWDQDGSGPIPFHSAVSPVWGGYTNFPFTSLDEAINGTPVPGFPNTNAIQPFVLNPATTPGVWSTAGRFAFGDVNDPTVPCLTLMVDPNAPDSIESASMTFTIDVNFTQFNAP